MGSQYLLDNNDSRKTIAVKFEHCRAIQIPIGNT